MGCFLIERVWLSEFYTEDEKLLFAELLKLAYDILIISKDIPTQGNPEELAIENINPYEEEYKLFIESVNKGQENDLLSAQAAIDVIAICLKARRSFRKRGRSIYWIE